MDRQRGNTRLGDTEVRPGRDYNWPDVLSRLRTQVRKGSDRIEWDVENDVVRGMSVDGTEHSEGT